MAELRSRNPHWRVDFVDLNGQLARVDMANRQIELDWAHLETDEDFTITYLTCLLEVCPAWPPSSACRQRANEVAMQRLGRVPHLDECERAPSGSDKNVARRMPGT